MKHKLEVLYKASGQQTELMSWPIQNTYYNNYETSKLHGSYSTPALPFSRSVGQETWTRKEQNIPAFIAVETYQLFIVSIRWIPGRTDAAASLTKGHPAVQKNLNYVLKEWEH